VVSSGVPANVDVASVLLELYDRVPPLVHHAVDDLDQEALAWRPAPRANSIGWLTWHLARVQDHHVADLLDTEQLWVSGPWAPRFGREPDPGDTGYGHTPDDVAALRAPDGGVIADYLHAVHDRTIVLLRGIQPGALDRIVDRRWDPPVTMGVRLISVADDCLQHAGQAAYVRGLYEARSPSSPSG
jgi:hypothetical protein